MSKKYVFIIGMVFGLLLGMFAPAMIVQAAGGRPDNHFMSEPGTGSDCQLKSPKYALTLTAVVTKIPGYKPTPGKTLVPTKLNTPVPQTVPTKVSSKKDNQGGGNGAEPVCNKTKGSKPCKDQ